ncbi:hypothetical protein [Rhizobium sp. AAP43]|uniref:hypothetical protein n=1 Tax=Rhizobium sp. AAP43 TaxID=1523420 RepID=UPI0012E239E1|nr:hypothetical protein [Rhizobium sp. AAP43]
MSQFVDPFRLGLVFFLFLTALRTRTATGLLMPLAFGVVFIAILIPLTTGANAVTETSGLTIAIATGVVANAVILAVYLGVWSLWNRVRQ